MTRAAIALLAPLFALLGVARAQEAASPVPVPARALHVRVIDFDGRPQADAQLTLDSLIQSARCGVGEREWSGKTGSDGSATIPGIDALLDRCVYRRPDGSSSLTLSVSGTSAAIFNAISLDRSNVFGASPSVTLRVAPNATVEIRVLDEDRAPVPSAPVRCEFGWDDASLVSDASGRLLVPHVEIGARGTIIVDGSALGRPIVEAPVEVTAAPGAVQTVEIIVPRSVQMLSVRARLLAPDGAPYSNVDARFERVADDERVRASSLAKTAADGTVRFELPSDPGPRSTNARIAVIDSKSASNGVRRVVASHRLDPAALPESEDIDLGEILMEVETTRDADVDTQRSVELRGRVLLDPSIAPEQVRCTVGSRTSFLSAYGTFAGSAPARGTAELHFWPRQERKIFDSRVIAVGDGDADGRQFVPDIDLRGRFHAFRLQFAAPDGAAIDEAWVRREGSDDVWSMVVDGGRAFVASEPDVVLLVQARGTRRERFTLHEGKQALALRCRSTRPAPRASPCRHPVAGGSVGR